MPIARKSINKLEKLKKVLEQMVDAGTVWNKAAVCKKIGACPTFLSNSPRWGASYEATRLYEEARKRIEDEATVSKWSIVDLEERCKELAAYNKQLRMFSERRIKTLEMELREERDRVSALERLVEQLQQQRSEVA